MATFSIKLSKDKINKIKETFKDDIKASPNEYIDTFINREGLTISIYTSDKVVFQGNDAMFYAQPFIEKKVTRQAGSDEVGTGDFFGPVCVCACIVEIDEFPLLDKLGVTDSKELTDNKIKEIGPILLKNIKHSLLILEPRQYNDVRKNYNLNAIKAKLHNKAYLNLIKKGYDIPKAAYIDEFAPSQMYFNYLKDDDEIFHDLIFETKAESKYPAVACASIIARYAFIEKMKELEKKYNMVLHKGSGIEVDEDAKNFIKKYGKDKLIDIAKIHFKNYEKL